MNERSFILVRNIYYIISQSFPYICTKHPQMLSILIPVHNYNVLPLVREVQQQAVAAGIMFEVIVLDDASTDAITVAENSRAAALPHVTYLANSTNLGRTATRKKLAEKAAYDTLLFLDADVMPASPDFIKNYIPFIASGVAVVFGGYAYHKENKMGLRLKYGIYREERPASERNANTFGSIFSGNLLVRKDIFLENNYKGKDNFYGMDIHFSYSLFKNKVPVTHIDNPIYHLGLEDDAVFFAKALKAVESRKRVLLNEPGIENINSLLKHYKTLKKYRLDGLVSIGFRIAAPLLKKMILKNNPSLFCLDVYRLGYICAIK